METSNLSNPVKSSAHRIHKDFIVRILRNLVGTTIAYTKKMKNINNQL